MGQVAAAVDEDKVGLGSVDQGAALGRDDPDLMGSRASAGSTSADGWRALVNRSSVLMRQDTEHEPEQGCET